MKPFRKLIALFIIIFISIPVLFSIIIAVGATRAVVSPELLSDLPQEILKNLPETIDELYSELKKRDLNDLDLNKNKKIWLKTILILEKTPKTIIEKSGISAWIKDELSFNFKKIGEILRGETEPEIVSINFEKLKTALVSPAMVNYLKDIISNLPECTKSQEIEWQTIGFKFEDFDEIPPCKPANLQITNDTVKKFIQYQIADIPDKIDLFSIDDDLPYGYDVVRFVTSISYLLFIIPAIFILIGSLIGASSKRDFFKWAGFTTIIGGLISLGFTSLIKNAIPLSSFAFKFSQDYSYLSADFDRALFSKLTNIGDIVFDKIFTPISEIAGIVAIVGLLIIAISYLVEKKD